MRPWRVRAGGLALALGCLFVAGCFEGGDDESTMDADRLAPKLSKAFRMDLSRIDATVDFWPQRPRISGSATLRFRMRPGQTHPLFQLNPVRQARPRLVSLELDGEHLDPRNGADVRRVTPAPSAEPGYEIERNVSGGEDHTLEVRWSSPKAAAPKAERWLFSNFDDTEGPNHMTETQWPTVSSPDELARQRVQLRVHSKTPYTALGSGRITRKHTNGVQAWEIDTQEAVSSSTVFAAAVPAEDVGVTRFRQSGVAVSLVSAIDRERTQRARSLVRRTIPRLIRDFGGPFPMPRVQILLTDWSSGMEYYGATRTGLGSLRHELCHMYFGVTAVNRTWRDTWFDEAAVSYWESTRDFGPARPGFTGNLVRGTPVSPGFNEAAYGRGARVLGWIAEALGGRPEMLAFLADLHDRRALEPFTTGDLIDDVVGAQDEISRAELERWFYGRT